MSDLNLTRDQWALCQRAGAALTPDAQEQDLAALGEQLALDGLGPVPGECYRNVHTGEIGCVLTAATRRKAWVTLHHGGRLTEIPLAWLGEHWAPCRPDGTAR